MQIQIINILNANNWISETQIVRAMFPTKRDSQITDIEWSEVTATLSQLKKSGSVKSQNIGNNEYIWSK